MHNPENHNPRLSLKLNDIFGNIVKQRRIRLHIKTLVANHRETHQIIESIEDLNFQVVSGSFTVSLRNVAPDLF